MALAGLFVIAALLEEPSQSGGFLGLSTGRWIFMFANLLALAGVFFSIYKVLANRAVKLEAWLSQKQHQFWLLFLSLALFAISLPAGLGWILAVRYFLYFGRIQPTLLWMAFASGSVTLTLLVALRLSISQWASQFIPLAAPAGETTPLSKTQRIIIGGFTLGYLALQLSNHLQVREAFWTADSIDYVRPATFGLFNLEFWTAARPWGISLFYTLTGDSLVKINILQVAFSSISWLALAWIFIQSLRSQWVKTGGFVLILGLSLVPITQLWNHVVWSESIAISLMILTFGLWISLLQRWHWFKFLALFFALGVWFHARETNAYLGLGIALGLLLIGLFKRRQRFYWLISLFFVGFFILNNAVSEMQLLPRWAYPLVNVILQRILPEPEYVRFFTDHGMPITPELLALSGEYAFSNWFAVFNHEEFRKFERWLFASGRGTYIRFLMTHIFYTFLRPLQDIETILTPILISYSSERYSPSLPDLINEILYPVRWFWGYLWISLAGAGAFISTKIIIKKTSGVFWGVCAFFVLTFPHFLLVWHGDAMEVPRHAVQANIQFHLGILLIFLFIADFLAVRKGE